MNWTAGDGNRTGRGEFVPLTEGTRAYADKANKRPIDENRGGHAHGRVDAEILDAGSVVIGAAGA